MAIVASGPSFIGVPYPLLSPKVHVIAVKGAIQGLARVDSWITVDANFWCRRDYMAVQKQRQGVKYYAAVPFDYGTPGAYRKWHRLPPEEGVHWLERIAGQGLAEDPSLIHTGNSAYAALGLAYHMGFRKIGLFGVDGTQDCYGVGYGRPRGDLGKIHDLFAEAIPQLEARGIEIKNAGRLRTWQQEPARDVIRWLNAA